MISLSKCARIAVAVFFVTTGGMASAQFSSHHMQETEGVLKGEMPLPSGLYRPRPFILAYSAAYGEQVIPVQEESLKARFEVKLKPGVYYLFFVLDGYEPTCHVAYIDPGEVVSYNPKQGEPILILDYISATPKREYFQMPLRQIQLPTVYPLPPQ